MKTRRKYGPWQRGALLGPVRRDGFAYKESVVLIKERAHCTALNIQQQTKRVKGQVLEQVCH